MVGCNHVDRPVQQPLKQRLPVFFTAQRRVHLIVAIAGRNILIGQQQVVWRGLTGNVHPLLLGKTDHGNAFLRGNVADVVVNAGRLGKHQVSGYLGRFGHARCSRHAQFTGPFALIHHSTEEEGVVFDVGC